MTKHVLLHKGFRPFFLVAALFAVALLPLWVAAFLGHLDVGGYMPAIQWHAHEMIFGFSMAVVAGFLLTAVAHWTNSETAVGAGLAWLVGLWGAGRLVMAFAGALPGPLVAMVDLAFLPALAGAIGRPILGTGNRRNFVFVGILAALWLANLVTHLGALGWVDQALVRPANLLAVDTIVLICLIIGGRVIPMFTRNATGMQTRSFPLLERASMLGFAALIVATLLAPAAAATGALAALVGAAVLARMARWGTQYTLGQPLLWVLHVGHAWIGLGLIFRGLANFTPLVGASIATHMLTAGAIGTLTLGMMARVALGHTGRELQVPRPVAWAFVALTVAVVLRTIVPLVWPASYTTAMSVAGLVWAAAFAVYAAVYLPILIRPRVDGRPG